MRSWWGCSQVSLSKCVGPKLLPEKLRRCGVPESRCQVCMRHQLHVHDSHHEHNYHHPHTQSQVVSALLDRTDAGGSAPNPTASTTAATCTPGVTSVSDRVIQTKMENIYKILKEKKTEWNKRKNALADFRYVHTHTHTHTHTERERDTHTHTHTHTHVFIRTKFG